MRGFTSLIVGTLLLLLPLPVRAEAPKVQAFGAYAFVRDQDLGEPFPLGFAAGAVGNITDWLGIVAEVSGSTRALEIDTNDLRLNLFSFLIGPQFSRRTNVLFTPFFQVLVGRARASGSVYGENLSSTQFAVQPGAGIDVAVSPRIGLRVEGDYRVISENLKTLAGGDRSKQFRLLIGVVFSGGR